jgi:hypothetical protein
MTGRAKWDAWSSAGKTYADRRADAEQRYLNIAQELGWAPGPIAKDTAQEEILPEDVWDEDLGVSVSRSSGSGQGGMGTFVSALPPPGDDDTEAQTLHALAIQGDTNKVIQYLEKNPLLNINQRDEFVWPHNQRSRIRLAMTFICRVIQRCTLRAIEEACLWLKY